MWQIFPQVYNLLTIKNEFYLIDSDLCVFK